MGIKKYLTDTQTPSHSAIARPIINVCTAGITESTLHLKDTIVGVIIKILLLRNIPRILVNCSFKCFRNYFDSLQDTTGPTTLRFSYKFQLDLGRKPPRPYELAPKDKRPSG